MHRGEQQRAKARQVDTNGRNLPEPQDPKVEEENDP